MRAGLHTLRYGALAAVLLLASAGHAAAEPRLSTERVVLHTTQGDLVLAFYPDVAPRHVEQILRLVRMGLYDTTSFYRVYPSFVAQLGTVQARRQPLTAEQAAAVHTIPAEISDLRHVRGVLSMAHEDGKPDSAETSFSILYGPAPHLDGKYTIFGRLDGGDDVLDAMAAIPHDDQYRPRTPIEIERAEVVDAPEALAELARRSKAPALTRAASVPRTGVAGDATGSGLPAPPFLALVALMMAIGFAVFLLAGKVPTRVVGSLGLLTVFVGAFLLYLALAPASSAAPWLAVSVFVASIGMFKLMSWFESEPKPTARPESQTGSSKRIESRSR